MYDMKLIAEKIWYAFYRLLHMHFVEQIKVQASVLIFAFFPAEVKSFKAEIRWINSEKSEAIKHSINLTKAGEMEEEEEDKIYSENLLKKVLRELFSVPSHW